MGKTYLDGERMESSEWKDNHVSIKLVLLEKTLTEQERRMARAVDWIGKLNNYQYTEEQIRVMIASNINIDECL